LDPTFAYHNDSEKRYTMAQHETSPQTVPPEVLACGKAIMDLCDRTNIISFNGEDIIPAQTIPSVQKFINFGIKKNKSYSCR
jgi:hypothetical protein